MGGFFLLDKEVKLVGSPVNQSLLPARLPLFFLADLGKAGGLLYKRYFPIII